MDFSTTFALGSKVNEKFEWTFSPIDEDLWGATFNLRSGFFTVEFWAEVDSGAWRSFLDELQTLHDKLDGEAILNGVFGSPILRFSIASRGRGHIRIRGQFIDHAGSEIEGEANRFEFSHLVIDQTELRGLLQQFCEATERDGPRETDL